VDKSYYRFYAEVGERFPEEEIVYKSLRGTLRRKFVLQHIRNWKGSLLDIGCNKGMYMKEYSGGEAVGVDISLNLLRHAVQRRINRQFSTYCILGDAEEISFIKSRTFDNILCSELLEHVYKPEKVILGIARILKHGGIVLITVPGYSRKRPTWTDIGILETYHIRGIRDNMYYHTAFKPEEIASMAQDAGLYIIEKGSFEKEIRYATKIPVLFYFILEGVNKSLIRSKAFTHWNNMLLDRFASVIYTIARILKLDPLLQKFFKVGARTFVLARKLA